MKSWIIYIDIEGFCKLWERSLSTAFEPLNKLMSGIYQIGCNCYPKFPECLCVFQAGDGFFIDSPTDYRPTDDKPLERPTNIAIALLRHVASTGYFAKAVIAEGDLADIQGCYPREITESHMSSNLLEAISPDNEEEHDDHSIVLREHGILSMGDGQMHIWPVMGTALIQARKVAESVQGPLFLAHESLDSRLPKGLDATAMERSEVASLDWVSYGSESLAQLQKNAGLEDPTEADLKKDLDRYCKDDSLPEEWVLNVRKYLLHDF
jgi:hypothetical protein